MLMSKASPLNAGRAKEGYSILSAFRYKIPSSMLGYMGRSFMAAIEPTLTEDNAWNSEIKEAWNSLFVLITDGMQRGYGSEVVAAPVVRFEEPPAQDEGTDEVIANDEVDSAFD